MKIKTPQLSVLFLSMFIFTLGFGIVVPVMPYFAKNMGGTIIDVGMLMAVFSAMELIFAPLWGKVSDQIGRKPVLMLGLGGFGVAFIIGGLSSHLWMLYASQIMAGILVAGVYPAATAYIADSTSPEERGGLMGMLGAAGGLGMIFGPGMASVFALWGLNIPFFAGAGVAFLTMIIGLLWLQESRIPGLSNQDENSISVKRALKLLFKSYIAVFFLLMAFIMLALASLEVTFGYFLIDRFGLGEISSAMPVFGTNLMLTGPNVIGIVFTFFGILSVITQALLVGKIIKRMGEEKTIVIGLLMFTIGTLILIFSWNLITLIISASAIAIALGLIMPSINTAVSNRTSEDKQGVMMGLLGSFNSAGRVFGPAIGGFLYAINMLLPYISSAVVSLLSAVVLQLHMRKKAMKR
ncbi:MAG TPA: MFS transporter [Methanobacteriaceae archaeon]|nr:MFS transporter [Methanobacteriaceae archaeon]